MYTIVSRNEMLFSESSSANLVVAWWLFALILIKCVINCSLPVYPRERRCGLIYINHFQQIGSFSLLFKLIGKCFYFHHEDIYESNSDLCSHRCPMCLSEDSFFSMLEVGMNFLLSARIWAPVQVTVLESEVYDSLRLLSGSIFMVRERNTVINFFNQSPQNKCKAPRKWTRSAQRAPIGKVLLNCFNDLYYHFKYNSEFSVAWHHPS